MTELLLRRAREVVAGAVPPSETSLLIVAHGTDLNENSAVAAKREADLIRRRGEYGAVLNTYMEEAPLVSDWMTLTSTPNVVVVPFFISDGLHSYEDIPVLLGIARKSAPRSAKNDAGEVFRGNPHKVNGRSLFYAPSIGTDRAFADIILQQVAGFDEAKELQTAS
jgi:sirohydrochlorin cobaltochelatase